MLSEAEGNSSKYLHEPADGGSSGNRPTSESVVLLMTHPLHGLFTNVETENMLDILYED